MAKKKAGARHAVPIQERTLAAPIKGRDVKKVRLGGLRVQYQAVTHEEEREVLDDKGRAVVVRIPRGIPRVFRVDASELSRALQNQLLKFAEEDIQRARLEETGR